MADDNRAGRIKRIQQAHDIPDQMKDSVLIDRLRTVNGRRESNRTGCPSRVIRVDLTGPR